MTQPLVSAKQMLHQPSDVYGGIQAGLSQRSSLITNYESN